MAEKPDTITQIAIELGVMFHPLQGAASSKDAFISFMRRLGWDADVVPDPVFEIGSAVESLLTEVKSFFTRDFTLDDLVELKNIIETLIDGINGIKTIADADLPEKLRTENFAQNFPKELIEYLIANYLLRYRKSLGFILQALGVIKVRHVKKTGNRLAHIHYDFSFDDIPKIIDSPGLLFKNAFGWGTPDFDFNTLSGIIQNLMNSIGTDVYIEKLDDDWIKRFDGRDASSVTHIEPQRSPAFVFFERARTSGERLQAKINMIKLPANGTSMPGVAILPFFNGVSAFTMQLGDDITATITSEMDFAGGIAAIIRPSEEIKLLTGFNQTEIPSEAHAAFTIEVDYAGAASSTPVTILGSADASRIEFKGVGIKGGISINSGDEVELLSEFQLKNLKVIIDFENSDGFIQKLIPIKHTEVSVDLTIGISSTRGVYFSGSATLEIRVPTHISLGPLEIQDTLVSIPFKNGGIGASIGLSLKAQLGPVTAIVKDVGLSINLLFPPQKDFFDFSVGFKPPSGAGLSVDAGGIKGGGILNFDPDNKEYFGALELEFKDLFSLKAFGIINTRMPDGSDGFSLLIIITAEFTPVQLGFGFTLNGVGGLLGVNRTTKVEVLKEGIKTNAIESILFPQNIVANINRIVSDIKQVFPPQNGHYLICPMGKIGWGTPTIITLELGILIEIPASGFIILGVLKALLPQEDSPVLKLQVNFLGVIDFENKSISFDASLYDSKILTFTLTGDMALRISFGDNPVFLLSVGGFHPAFKEIPADLQNMKRITLSLYDGDNARIIIQTYFAVTSNTAQFGAKAELFAGSEGGFNIYGFVNYDVLFQFSPFKFIADLAAGVALRHGSSVIMSVHVSGELSGPTPWDAKGEAGVSFFFFSVSVPFHVTWGDANNEPGKEKADILSLLTDEINNSSNWKAAIPNNNKLHVSIRAVEQNDALIAIHPFGILTFSERLVPLELDINKFGNQLPKDANYFIIKPTDETLDTEYATEQFAPANFLDMSDDEKLSRPSFEPMKSGFKITGSEKLQAPQHVADKKVDYEFSYLGKKKKPRPDKYNYPGSFFKAHSKTSAAAQSSLSYLNNRDSLNGPDAVAIEEEQYVIANISDMKIYGSEMRAGSYSEAIQYYNDLVKTKPELRDQVQVLSKYELNLN